MIYTSLDGLSSKWVKHFLGIPKPCENHSQRICNFFLGKICQPYELGLLPVDERFVTGVLFWRYEMEM